MDGFLLNNSFVTQGPRSALCSVWFNAGNPLSLHHGKQKRQETTSNADQKNEQLKQIEQIVNGLKNQGIDTLPVFQKNGRTFNGITATDWQRVHSYIYDTQTRCNELQALIKTGVANVPAK